MAALKRSFSQRATKPAPNAPGTPRERARPFPNGAETCTPCTAGRTRSSISRAIAMPSATACSFDFALARAHPLDDRRRAPTTPGTSFARNSALRSETSGQMPAMIGIRDVLDASRGIAPAAPTSNTGCVIAYSAPASTFHSKRLSSCAGSSAAGFTPTPIVNCVGCADRVAAGIEAAIQLADEIRETDRVDVEDRGRVRDTVPSSAGRP